MYSCTSVNVGLVTAAGSMPSPSARPRTNAVLPAPRSPDSSTTEFGASAAASCWPTAAVSASECVVVVTLLGLSLRGELLDRGAEMRGQIGGGHRHFAFVGCRQIASHAVQIHRQLA